MFHNIGVPEFIIPCVFVIRYYNKILKLNFIRLRRIWSKVLNSKIINIIIETYFLHGRYNNVCWYIILITTYLPNQLNV